MMRWEILNRLIEKHGYTRYLEIGTQNPHSNFNRIHIKHKFCVEPNPHYGGHDYSSIIDFVGTSDAYFDSIKGKPIEYDIIFIDGLHHNDQVLRDIENSLNHLSGGGTIMCHDTLPTHPNHAVRVDPGGIWNGDVYRAIMQLRVERDDLMIHTIDTDHGCTIIQRGKSSRFAAAGDWDTWDFYMSKRNEIMNVVGTNSHIL